MQEEYCKKTVIGYFQSLERFFPATVLALLRGFIFLIPSFMLLPELLGTHGIWLALCLSELLTAVTIAVLFGLNMMRHRGMARQGRLL